MAVEIRAVVITASDACASGHRADESGDTLVRLLGESNAVVVEKLILSDDLEPLVEAVMKFSERGDVNLIITNGGTGLGPRDNTPEATLRVIEREVPGVAEAMLSLIHISEPTRLLSISYAVF